MNCQVLGSRLLVFFKNFSRDFWVFWKSKIISYHQSHVCSFLDTFWYICFVIALCRLQYIPTLKYSWIILITNAVLLCLNWLNFSVTWYWTSLESRQLYMNHPKIRRAGAFISGIFSEGWGFWNFWGAIL